MNLCQYMSIVIQLPNNSLPAEQLWWYNYEQTPVVRGDKMATNKLPIIPNHYFAQASSECQTVFENRCYFACISLCQSLAEAYARFMYEVWSGKKPDDNFYGNITKMRASKVQPDVADLLNSIYGGQQRHDFHHLNNTVPTEYQQLQSMATEKIDTLNKVESQVFEQRYVGGKLWPRYPQYWKTPEGKPNVFLRLDNQTTEY